MQMCILKKNNINSINNLYLIYEKFLSFFPHDHPVIRGKDTSSQLFITGIYVISIY